MAKYNKPKTRARVEGPIKNVTTTPNTRTREGGAGYTRDAKSEVFLLAASGFAGERAFYEKVDARTARYVELVQQVAVQDPDWTRAFLKWLREDGNMRTASMVGALEAAAAMLAHGIPGGRAMVDSVLQRADEPGEALAYWMSVHGRSIPKPIKRGIADAVKRLYTEYAMLKYDTDSHGIRFGDVLDLTHVTGTHPEIKGTWQGDLFKYALGRRHNRDNLAIPASLPMVQSQFTLRAHAQVTPSALLDPDRLKAAGMTWEDVTSLAGSKVDKAALWTALIPTMGYMALLRNLRNFDQAGVSDAVAATVAARLADPDQVARSRQFPFRFWSAYRATTDTVRWAHPVQTALDLSLANVPSLPGRTLVLVDVSPSMYPMYMHIWSQEAKAQYERTGLAPVDFASLFGLAVALRATSADLVEFGDTSRQITLPKNGSLLPLMKRFEMISGTNIHAAINRHYTGQDRVIILTDEQTREGTGWERKVPANIPLYVWNFGGYQAGAFGGPNRNTFGGLTDESFKLIPLLEAGHNADWPWMA